MASTSQRSHEGPQLEQCCSHVSLNLCSLDSAVRGELGTRQGLLTGKPIVGFRKSSQLAPSSGVELIWFGEKCSWWVGRSSGVSVRHRPECWFRSASILLWDGWKHRLYLTCLDSRRHWALSRACRKCSVNRSYVLFPESSWWKDCLTDQHNNEKFTGLVPVISC